MDFFEHQDRARRYTGRLIACFALAVTATVLAVYGLVLIAQALLADKISHAGPPKPILERLWQPEFFIVATVGTLAVILAGSLQKTWELASGGEPVALMLGGRLLNPQTTDLAERRLLNVVEEMALASGMPVPPVYVLDQETAINAFAAGHTPDDAVIGVSRGCLECLTRDELQGVMGHEFSHILNGDMRLNLRLIGILHGILLLALLGWYLLRSIPNSGRARRGKGGKGVMMLAILGGGLIVIGGIGLFFAKLIRSAISRQREYLADAAAVQFTRLPEGIAGALKKIGGHRRTSRIGNAHAEEVSHMFFANALSGFLSGAFATHPPLIERVRRIEPTFDGTFPKTTGPAGPAEPIGPLAALKPRVAATLDRAVRAIVSGAAPIGPAAVLSRAGVPDPQQIAHASEVLQGVPAALRHAAHEPYAARGLVYAVLLSRDTETRRQQLAALTGCAEGLSVIETKRFAPLVDNLGEDARVPLVETTFPALKSLAADQYARFRQNIAVLIEADRQIDLLEYAVRTMLIQALDVHFQLAKPAAVRHHRLDPLLPSLVAVLSTLAHAGQPDEAAARRAFDRGMQAIGRTGQPVARSACSLRQLDEALKALAEAAPRLKREILRACIACVTADNKITPHEGQLIQAISATLGVPLPPLLPAT